MILGSCTATSCSLIDWAPNGNWKMNPLYERRWFDHYTIRRIICTEAGGSLECTHTLRYNELCNLCKCCLVLSMAPCTNSTSAVNGLVLSGDQNREQNHKTQFAYTYYAFTFLSIMVSESESNITLCMYNRIYLLS